jgi:hypothetical protein
MKPLDELTQLQKKVTDAMRRHNCSLELPIVMTGDFNAVPHQVPMVPIRVVPGAFAQWQHRLRKLLTTDLLITCVPCTADDGRSL